jgi:hypothetical protein
VGPRGNTSVFRPYRHIFAYTYGGGNDRFTEARNGYLIDANVFGSRIDYAVAANLNVFGSFFHAQRLSHGYGFGYIRPALDGANNSTGLVEYVRQGGVTAPAMAIPNNELGYEIDCGLNWQLLESYTLTGLFGIWQPGKWFNFACIDRSNAGWKTPAAGNNWGTDPDRKIDPVFAMEIALRGTF